MERILESISQGIITERELFNFIEDFPALLWRIDIIKNKIEYLNSYQIKGFGPKSGHILQNMDFSRNVILKEDIHLFLQFMRAMQHGETAATVFRVKLPEGGIVWIKVTGTANRKNPRYYLGYMLDVTDTVGIVQDIIDGETITEIMIEQVKNPVILIDTYDKTVLAQNRSARDLFCYSAKEFLKLNFSDLYHPSSEHFIHQIYEEIIFKKKWQGKLTFQRLKELPFMGSVVIRSLYFGGTRVFQISINDVSYDDKTFQKIQTGSPKKNGLKQLADKNYQKKLIRKLKYESDMSAILQTFLDNQYGHMNFDFIIYSDVYEKKNKVVVYTASKYPSTIQQGEVFSYEGTIAQNISRYNLDYLIVEDTFSSIKAIDWALFIPQGLMSYFAKPFFDRGIMRTVLVLCSRKKNIFSDDFLPEYELLYEPFLLGLTNWRKARRNKKV
ncbi:MAG: PAS domain-containing protein [Proteobacteria bacterium]|nr:PAS domain-containing protein [Pseudomonadota bacterium]MBU1584894.1 PAS domain-containing protein [Pseudomonadota bacterium]MBU2631478.1 PAS domain-containing protein [Pseudomonadota bacterium]